MTKPVKVLITKPDNVSSIPGSHTMGGENKLWQAVPRPPHGYPGWNTSTCIYTQQISVTNMYPLICNASMDSIESVVRRYI